MANHETNNDLPAAENLNPDNNQSKIVGVSKEDTYDRVNIYKNENRGLFEKKDFPFHIVFENIDQLYNFVFKSELLDDGTSTDYNEILVGRTRGVKGESSLSSLETYVRLPKDQVFNEFNMSLIMKRNLIVRYVLGDEIDNIFFNRCFNTKIDRFVVKEDTDKIVSELIRNGEKPVSIKNKNNEQIISIEKDGFSFLFYLGPENPIDLINGDRFKNLPYHEKESILRTYTSYTMEIVAGKTRTYDELRYNNYVDIPSSSEEFGEFMNSFSSACQSFIKAWYSIKGEKCPFKGLRVSLFEPSTFDERREILNKYLNLKNGNLFSSDLDINSIISQTYGMHKVDLLNFLNLTLMTNILSKSKDKNWKPMTTGDILKALSEFDLFL